MNTEYPLTLVEFDSWLKSKNEGDIIGLRGCCIACPILRCLENKNEEVIAVGELESQFNLPNGKHGNLENPKWVTYFVREIDKPGTSSKVTVKEALEVVNNFFYCTVCEQDNPKGTNCGKKDNCPW